MELRHIRYFLAVVREGSFSRAADQVGIGQSPLSQQIRDLEREVGTALFRRVSHGAELTSAGQAFYKEVSPLLPAVEGAVHAAQRAARGETGVLNIGFTASSAFNAAVPGGIRAFRLAYPDIRLNLTEVNTTELVRLLRGGGLDVAFLRPEASGSDEFRLRPVAEEAMVAAVPSSSAAAGRDGVALAELVDEPLLLFPREIGPVLFDAVMDAFRSVAVEPRRGQTVPQIASTINFVSASLGFSIIPESMSRIAVPGVLYKPILDAKPVARIVLAARKGETRAIVKNFVTRAIPANGAANLQSPDANAIKPVADPKDSCQRR